MSDHLITTPDDAELAEAIVEVDIDAMPEAVWDALTTPDGFAGWLGEGSTIGAAPGEDLHVNDVVTGEQKRGVLDEVTPHRRLGYTWWPETAPERATRVAISLEPCPGGTRVTVIETRPTALPTMTAQAKSVQGCSAQADWMWRSASLVVGVVEHDHCCV